MPANNAFARPVAGVIEANRASASASAIRLDRRRLIQGSAMLAMPAVAATAMPVRAKAEANGSRRFEVKSTAQSTPPSGAAGQSQARWEGVHEAMAGFVKQGTLPGLITLVAHGDDVSVDAIGTLALGGSAPMRRDTIFRIASMTKPVTAAAAMLLVEDGTLALDGPAEEFLPELANRRVLTRLDGPVEETVPAARPITVRDLLTFVQGFGLVFDPDLPITRAAAAQGLNHLGPPQPQAPPAPDAWIARFARLPLMFQPGGRWLYDAGTDILGVLIARAAQQSFDTFLQDRIFAPLGMRDTGFFVPAAKLDRFPTSYWTNPATGVFEVVDDAADSQWGRPPAFPSGSAGLVSTVDDYLAFAQMLLNGGTHRGTGLLSPESIAQMTTDQLTADQKTVPAQQPFDVLAGRGWGFGMAVVTAPDDLSAVPGRYGWDGGIGTSWLNDPHAGLSAMVMTQSGDFLFSDALPAFWAAVYAAVVR